MKRWLLLLCFFQFGQIYVNPEDNAVYFSLPDLTWSLCIDLSGFTVNGAQISDNGTERMIQFDNSSDGIKGLITIEPVDPAFQERFSDHYFQEIAAKYGKNFHVVKKNTFNDLFCVWYLLKNTDAETAFANNMAAFLFKDEYAVLISLGSSIEWDEFISRSERVVASAFIENQHIFTPEEMMAFGKYYFIKQNFFSAIKYFSMVVEYDEGSSLDDREYVELVTLAAASYTITGSQDSALDLLKKGLVRLPEEPLFYYNIAALLAIFGTPDEVIEYLDHAFTYAVHQQRSSELPNPLDDPAFQFFIADRDNLLKLKSVMAQAGLAGSDTKM